MGLVIKGSGVDIIEISRIARAITREKFVRRIFHPEEIKELGLSAVHSLAARFAAKEAVMKALGCGWQLGVGFSQIQVIKDALGKPEIQLHGRALEYALSCGVSRLLLSLSHSRELAVAYVLALGEES